MIRRAMALLVCGVIVGCAGSAPSAASVPTPLPPQPGCRAAGDSDALCVIALGDSIAAGVPLVGDDRWWVRLQTLLSAALPDRRVVVDAWAVPGGRVDVLESAARDQPLIDTYDVALVIEGVNDQGTVPLDAWLSRYRAAVGAIEGRGPRVVVATPPPNIEGGALGAAYDPAAEAIRGLATDRRPVLDLSKRWHADGTIATTYYADLIHQNAVGQALMALMARDIVEALVADR